MKKTAQIIALAVMVLFVGVVGLPDARGEEFVVPDQSVSETHSQAEERVRRRDTAHVEAIIRDADANPLRGIGVAIYALDRVVDEAADGQAVARAVTNNQGKAVFECLKLGHHRMEVESLRGSVDYAQGGSAEFVLDHEGRALKWTASKLGEMTAKMARSSLNCFCPNKVLSKTQEAGQGWIKRISPDVGETRNEAKAAPPHVSSGLANIESVVRDPDGNPLAGVGVLIRDAAGNIVTREVTNANGKITVACLELGEYTMNIEPDQNRWQGGSVELSLGQEGKGIAWLTSEVLPAVSRLAVGGGICRCGVGRWWSKQSLTLPLITGLGIGLPIGLSGDDSHEDTTDISAPVSPSQ